MSTNQLCHVSPSMIAPYDNADADKCQRDDEPRPCAVESCLGDATYHACQEA